MPNTPTPTPTPTPTLTPTPSTCSPTLTTSPATATFTISLSQSGQPLQWHMTCNGTDFGTTYPSFPVPLDTQGVFNFTITQGANFAANGPGNQINAIGIVGGSAKPPQAGNGSGLITVSTPTSTTLSFTDSNTTKAANKLNYVLYFTDGSKVDPIIDNGGCCTVGHGSFYESTAFVVAVAVLAVLILAYVGYRLFGAKRTGPMS